MSKRNTLTTATRIRILEIIVALERGEISRTLAASDLRRAIYATPDRSPAQQIEAGAVA